MRRSIIVAFGAILTAFAVSSCESNEEVLYSRYQDVDVNIAKTPEFNIYSGGTTIFNNISTRALGQDGMMMTRALRSKTMTNPLIGDGKIMTEAPEVPDGAVDITTLSKDGGYYKVDNKGVYVVKSGTTVEANLNMNSLLQTPEEGIRVYVENGAKWIMNDGWGSVYKYIYVLPGGTLEWGYNSNNAGELTVGNGVGAEIHCWGTILPKGGGSTISSVTIKAKSKLYIYKGNMEFFDVSGQLFLENNDAMPSYLYSEIPTTFGKIDTNGGEFHFANKFLCVGDFKANDGGKYIFDKCATVAGYFTLSGGNTEVDINEALTVEKDFEIDNGNIYLKEALLDVTGTKGGAGKATLKDNGSIYGVGTTKSVFRAKQLYASDFQNTNAADVATLENNLVVLCSDDNISKDGGQALKDMTFWDGGANKNLSSWTIALDKLADRNVFFNPEDEKDYYLPATDCRPVVGKDPNGGKTDPDPTPTTIDEVEVNLSINDPHINGDYVASKLSIHVRSITDVQVFIPLEKQYYCDKDDMDIALTHNDVSKIKYNTESTNVEMLIGSTTVKMTVSFEDNGIRFTTDGINEEVINYCRTNYGDGITFEIWNYYNNITRTNLKTQLDKATVEFLDKAPGRYVNAFNELRNYTGEVFGKQDANGVWTPYTDKDCTQVLDQKYWYRPEGDPKNYVFYGYKNPEDCVVKPVDTEFVTYTEENQVHYNVYYKKN